MVQKGWFNPHKHQQSARRAGHLAQEVRRIRQCTLPWDRGCNGIDGHLLAHHALHCMKNLVLNHS